MRKAENIGKKVASWKNHRMFNLRCFRRKLIPRSIRLVSNVQGIKAEHLLLKTELNLLQIRIRQCNFTLKKLRVEEENSIALLHSKLSEPEVTQVNEHLAKSKQTHFDYVKSRQQDKFDRLLASKTSDSVTPQPSISQRKVG